MQSYWYLVVAVTGVGVAWVVVVIATTMAAKRGDRVTQAAFRDDDERRAARIVRIHDHVTAQRGIDRRS